MKIILSGGGTIGSVSPLLAIYQEIKQRDQNAEFLWVATRQGPEHELIKSYNIIIKPIFAGKLRRYFSFKNLIDPIYIVIGFFQSISIIKKFQPDMVLSAGGFVSVPLAWAAKLLGKNVLIHQQDVKAGLANKLMASSASIITVTFEKTKKDFPKDKVKVVGNPVRVDILQGDKDFGYTFFQLNSDLPTILITGGGTGALKLNNLVLDSLQQLVKFCQVIHLTGGKMDRSAEHSHYRSYDFLTKGMKNAYAVADLIISRAGMSALTEIALLNKPAIIIPITNSHQEKNAIEFAKNNAIAMFNEKDLNSETFPQVVRQLINNKIELQTLSRNISKVMPPEAAKKIVDLIYAQ